MKKLLTILFLGLTGQLVAQQKPAQFISGLNVRGEARDQLQVDSLLYLPLVDTTKAPGRSGVLVVKASNNKIYLYDGIYYRLLIGSNDTSSMLANYLRSSDTTGKWISIGKRYVDTAYRVNDSVLAIHIRDGNGNGVTTNISIKGTGGGGPGATPTLQQVLTAGNQITVSPQLIKGTGPTVLQWDSLTNINWRHKGFFRIQADGGQQSAVFQQSSITLTAGDSVTISTPSTGFSVFPIARFYNKVFPFTQVGTAGTDSVLVKKSDGSIGSISATYYGTGGGGGSGTVTNVATGYGLSGGPITTTGTLLVDSATLSSYYLRRKDSTLYATVTALATKQPTGSYITSLTTDVVATGPGAAAATIQPLAVTTAKINNNAVTYAKIQAASGQALLGATGAGNYQEITLGTNLSMSGSVLNATGGGGSVTVRDSLSYINGAKFGMVGDGTTDNTAILQALINAGYRSIYVPKGVYVITAVQMKDSVTIWGDGRQNSIFKLTGNTTAFTCSAALGGTKCEFWNIGFQGTFGGTGNSGQKAIVLDTVNGCYVNNVGGYFLGGFLVTVKGNAFIAGNGFTFGNIISNCYTETCGGSGGGGVLLDTRAEYNKVIGCSFSDGGVGVQSNGGNNLISDNDLSTNGWGIYLGAGSNDGHGIASNNTMNHCSYGVYVDGITLGYTFIGNHIYACVTDAVFINNSTGIYFTGGTIDGNASSPLMSVTSSSNISFNMVRFPTAPTWTTTSSTGISIISSMTNMSGINIIDPFHSSKNSTIATADGVVTFNTFSGGEYDFDKTVVLAGAAADLTRSFCAVSARLDGGSSGPTDLFQVYRTGTTGSSMAILDNAANYSLRAMPSGKIGLGNNSTPAVSLVTASTDAWGVPNGTTAQRPAGAAAYIRYNSDSSRFEGYNGAWKGIAWTSDAGGGGGSDTLKVVNAGTNGQNQAWTSVDTLNIKRAYGPLSVSVTTSSPDSGLIYKLVNDTALGTAAGYFYSTNSAGRLGFYPGPSSGSYTPTFTNTTNVTSSSLQTATYTRIGNMVHVNIGGTLTPTTINIASVLTVTLPFTTATTSQIYIGHGSIGYNSGGEGYFGGLFSVVSGTTGTFLFEPTVTTGSTAAFNFSFDYTL